MQDRLIWYSLRRWVPFIWSMLSVLRIRKSAIVNIGAEEEKGNALVKETFPLIKRREGYQFYWKYGGKRDSAWTG